MSMGYVSFLKTDEEFGGLSNMSGRFPVVVNGIRVFTSEHLYQSLKFTNHPEIQKEVLGHGSPMRSKMVTRSQKNQVLIRPDWKDIQLEVMYFCLKVKLVWNWVSFGDLIRSTGNREIVEISSRKDRYWGVTKDKDGFVGENHLGKLLMKLRDELNDDDNSDLRRVIPPKDLGLSFLDNEIQVIDRRHHLCQVGTRMTNEVSQIRP